MAPATSTTSEQHDLNAVDEDPKLPGTATGMHQSEGAENHATECDDTQRGLDDALEQREVAVSAREREVVKREQAVREMEIALHKRETAIKQRQASTEPDRSVQGSSQSLITKSDELEAPEPEGVTRDSIKPVKDVLNAMRQEHVTHSYSQLKREDKLTCILEFLVKAFLSQAASGSPTEPEVRGTLLATINFATNTSSRSLDDSWIQQKAMSCIAYIPIQCPDDPMPPDTFATWQLVVKFLNRDLDPHDHGRAHVIPKDLMISLINKTWFYHWYHKPHLLAFLNATSERFNPYERTCLHAVLLGGFPTTPFLDGCSCRNYELTSSLCPTMSLEPNENVALGFRRVSDQIKIRRFLPG